MIRNLETIIDFYVRDQVNAQKRDDFMRSFTHSGYGLIDKIDPTESVIDIGCGQNLFKPYLPNLVGIDPATDQADIKISLQEFVTDRLFDVALCLGSIQGDDEEVCYQISLIKGLLKPQSRIYWRCMPDPPPYAVPSWMSLWTFDRHVSLAKTFGFTVADIQLETRPGTGTPRIYAEWHRSPSAV